MLGPVEVRGSAAVLRAPKPITVLTTLLVHANAWVDTDTLIAVTWPEQAAPASANANLKTYVWQLRRALPAGRVEQRPGAYRLRVEAGELDIDEAERLAALGRRARADGDLETAADLFAEALGLWRGKPFGGLCLDTAVGTRAWLDALHRDLRSALADIHFEQGRVNEAIMVLRGLVDEDPVSESAWARWVAALARAGRHGEALALCHRARAVLAAELGVRPGAELTAAHRLALGNRVEVRTGSDRRHDVVRAGARCGRP
ncbi:AfsR/SARP family transcriptional regulator [Actinokineospora iranica]|uniref:AfsR/SARP family transcriptional regulator n=1 Tax=Actinokineospora iranica TaxID=1271860 RepID=UPI001587596D|nr:AfsR/SARP family transcriptional regulator [Actinokineospora iranica]